MKTRYIMITAFIIFLVLSIFSGLKIRQIRKVTEQKTKLEERFNNLQKEKDELKKMLVQKQVENSVLSGQKSALESKLIQSKEATQKQIDDYKEKIRSLSSIPPDTIYQIIFAKFPAFDQPLMYRFSESQIRGIHLSLLERDQFAALYDKTSLSLVHSEDLNKKNSEIITNLTDQNTILNTNSVLSDEQIDILKNELKLSNRLLNRQKRKTFIYKGSTFLATTGLLIFVLK